MADRPAPRPQRFTWNGQAMVPTMPGVAKRQFVKGESYLLELVGERSYKSHAHYFAALHEGWQNLPHHLLSHFPSAEALRKYLLIKCGYHDVRTVGCASPEEARRMAAFIKPLDEYAIVTTEGVIVQVHTAKSQSMKTMKRKEFQKSKHDVLDALGAMIGVDRRTLDDNAGQAA